MKIITGWISAGESGSVVGLPGCGRTNLLGFLCHRPEVLQSYLPLHARQVALVSVDINNLPANSLSALYRVILRSFYRIRDNFDPTLQQTITALYLENRAEQDPFLSQSALQELLLLFQTQQIQVVLVLNRFDYFCQMATLQMVNTLRGLRDSFKDTLTFIAGMPQETAYLPDPAALGDMYELLDSHICWVGAMNDDDARNLVARTTLAASAVPTEADVAAMLTLTGGFPSLLRAVCYWWQTTENRPPHAEWGAMLAAERNLQHRLAKIWIDLTQEEQFILSELQKLQIVAQEKMASESETAKTQSPEPDETLPNFVEQHHNILSRLAIKGLCRRIEWGWGWRIAADVLAAYVANIEQRGRGRIWVDEKTGEIYQGQTLLKNFTALERSVLSFLINHPYTRHTKTALIINTWPDELRRQGVTDNSLYQVIFVIRREIEPTPGKQSYLVTWRGKPEGGYQFFPEGRPG